MAVQRIPFAIASDEAVSKGYSRQRLLNLYAETPQLKAKSPVLIVGRPGLRPWGSAGGGPVRGTHTAADGTLCVVSGSTFYTVAASGVATSRGSIPGTGFVIMADNGVHVQIASGNAWVDQMDTYAIWGRDETGSAYLYNLAGESFTEVTDPDLFLDGRGKFQISGIADASSYDALDFATAEKAPDAIIRGFVDRAYLFLFGFDSIEVWYNSGNADFPFERVNQSVIPKGIMGRCCVASLDNSLFWVGRDPKAGGTPIVYRLDGFEASRVSTHACEAALAEVTDWSLVRIETTIVKGHAFLHVILPDAPAWVYDCASKLWHEEETTAIGRWLGNSHSSAYGKDIVGSCADGQLFELDPDYQFDDAAYIVREAVSAPVGGDTPWKSCAMFQADIQTGTGLVSGQGMDPQIMMQYSDDRGRTWSNEKWRTIGALGQYGLKVIWRQLGRFRSRVFKLRITDPVEVRFLDFFADIV